VSGGPVSEVWVTGLGIASALGTTLDGVAEAQREGRSGARPLSEAFDTSAFPVKVACRVPDWDLQAQLGDVGDALIGRADRKAEFGLFAAVRALESAFGSVDAARAVVQKAPRRVGVHLASGLVSTPREEAEQDLLSCFRGGRYDHVEAAARLQMASPYRGRHFTDRVNQILAGLLGYRGPSLVNHAACSAGAVAIGSAAHWIRRGRCDVAIAGGYESMIHPFGVLSFQMLGALSERVDCEPHEVSRPFDRSRDGFVIGEGGAALVLESAEHARRRGAQCLGRILGLGTSLDAYRATAPPPDGHGAASAMRAALLDAGVAPGDIDYINAHGTGTPLNDAAESRAIIDVFGGPGQAPPVSSSKSGLGHAVAAAGAVEAILSLLALRDGILPPTLNLHDPDPDCPLDYVPLVAREAPIKTVLSNSFGFGGVNAALVLGGPA
jgi:3-oxoacyl-[acyl-carrier-protein] synthase II